MAERSTSPGVLHIVHWSSGGLAKIAQDLILAKNGMRARLIVLRNNGGAIDSRIHCDTVDCASFFKRIRRLRKIIREFRPDVIHVHSFTPLCCAVLLAPRGTCLVRTIHSPYPYFHSKDIRSRVKRTLERVLHGVRRATIVCVSTAVADSLPWHSGKPRVIANGVDFEKIQAIAREPIEECNPLTNAITIISAGRLEPEKNFTLLIRAFALAAHASTRPLRLRILGQGSQHNLLRELANGLHMTDQVEFLGHRPNPFPDLHNAHIYASTSLYEGLSLSLIEAMGIGLPVVATRSSRIPDRLHHMRDLIVVDDNEPESFSKALLQLIEEPGLRKALAASALGTVRIHYSVTRMSSEYSDLYRSLLQ